MYIDSHAHLDGKRFDSDREQVLQRARAAGVDAVFSKASEDMDKMIATARTTFAKQKPKKRFAQQK